MATESRESTACKSRPREAKVTMDTKAGINRGNVAGCILNTTYSISPYALHQLYQMMVEAVKNNDMFDCDGLREA